MQYKTRHRPDIRKRLCIKIKISITGIVSMHLTVILTVVLSWKLINSVNSPPATGPINSLNIQEANRNKMSVSEGRVCN